MSQIFISYSRKDKAFVSSLHEALEQRDRETWVDWEGIPPTAEWLEEIFEAIDAAEAFVFVISPDSLASKVCGEELQYAVDQNKRLIPLVFRDADAEKVPPSLGELNWIFIREQDPFEPAIDTLIEALDTDLERVKAHTRLLVRAREWSNREHNSLLLRTRDLEEAELEFAGGAELEPRPTPLQLRYITASRNYATTVQRRILASVTTAMLVAITLAIVAWVQREYSERRETAAVVRNVIPAKPMTGLAQAIDATGQWFSDAVPEVRSSLLGALQAPKERTVYFLNTETRNPVSKVAVAQNGAVVAALDPRYDRTMSLAAWDARGERKSEIGIGAEVIALAACSGEPVVLVVSADGRLSIRDVRDGAELQAAKVEIGDDSGREPQSAAPAPTSSYDLPPPDDSGLTETIDPGQDQLPTELAGTRCSSGPGAIKLAAFSADCSTIVIGRECATEAWSRTPGLERLWLLTEAQTPSAIAVDASGTVVVRGYRDGYIRKARSSGRDYEVLDVGYASGSPVSVLAVSPDGASTASTDGNTVRLWRDDASPAAEGGVVIYGHEDEVSSLAFDPKNGSFLVSGSHDNSIRVWDLDGNALGEPLRGHDSWVRSIAVSRDGSEIVSGSNDGSVRRWEVERNLVHLPCNSPLGEIRVLAVTNDGNTRLVQKDSTGDLYTQDGECEENLVAGGPGRQFGTLSPDGKFLAFATEGGSEIVLRDAKPDVGGVEDVEIEYPYEHLRAIAIAPDGTTLAGAGNDGTVRLRSFEKPGWEDLPIEHKDRIASLAFSTDGRFLASGGENNTVVIWDTQTQEKIEPLLQGHKGWVSAIAFSPDGRFIATGSWDRTVRLWDIEGNPMGIPFRGHSKWITYVGFHPKDPAIISYGFDQKVGRWQGGDRDDWLNVSCRQLLRHPVAVETPEKKVDARARAVCSSRGLPVDDEVQGDSKPDAMAVASNATTADPEPQSTRVIKAEAPVEDLPGIALGDPFLMVVEDVFSIPGRGTIASGRVERGVIKVGEEVEIVGLLPTTRATLGGIEAYRQVLGEARAGDYVGVQLNGTTRDKVRSGQVLATPGSISPHRKFKGEVHFLTEAEGGRSSPFSNDYRPQFFFRTTETGGLARLPEGKEMVMPGDRVTLDVTLTKSIAMKEGLRFDIREGGRRVGSGVVTEILD